MPQSVFQKFFLKKKIPRYCISIEYVKFLKKSFYFQEANLMACQSTSGQPNPDKSQIQLSGQMADSYTTTEACGCPLSVTRQPKAVRFRLRGLAFVLAATFVVAAVAVGVSKIRAKPTLHVTFPASVITSKSLCKSHQNVTNVLQLS